MIIVRKPTKNEKIFSVIITLIIVSVMFVDIIPKVYATDYDECVYITNTSSDCVYIIDISDFNNLNLTDTVTWGAFRYPFDIHVYDEYMYVSDSDNDEMYVFDVSDVTNAVQEDVTTDMFTNPYGLSIDEDNEIAYLTCYGDSDVAVVVAYDISNPSNVVQLGYWEDYAGSGSDEVLDSPETCVYDNDYLYVGSTNNENLVVFDVSNYLSISNVSDIDGDEGGSELKVQGDYLYAVNEYGDGGLAIFDISNGIISEVGNYETDSPVEYCLAVDVYDEIVFIGGKSYSAPTSFFSLIDVSDKSNPVLITKVSDSNYINQTVNSIELINENTLGILTNNYFILYDVSVPAYPTYLNSINYGGKNMFLFGIDFEAEETGYPYDFIFGWIKWILLVVVILIIIGLAFWIKSGWRY